MATVVLGDQKAPFLIASTRRCRGQRNSFPWIATLYLWYVPYIAECQARRYQVPLLKSLVWRDLGLNPGLPNHWRTLWRCPWCNGYRCRKWTWRHEFKSWTRLIAFYIALIPLGNVWIQLFSLQLWVNSRTD